MSADDLRKLVSVVSMVLCGASVILCMIAASGNPARNLRIFVKLVVAFGAVGMTAVSVKLALSNF